MIPKIFVVTSVHNSLSHTKKFLESFSHQTYKSYQIILVDDGSTDNTALFIKKTYPKVKILSGNGSLWWTGGINLAISESMKSTKAGDFILTINNDCVVDSTYLEKIASTSSAHQRSIGGSLGIEQATKRVHTGYLHVDWRKGIWLNQVKDVNVIKSCDHLSTKGTLFPIEVFQKIGLLDEVRLPHYGSDFEFTNRARLNGFILLLGPDCVVYCDHERTGLTRQSRSVGYLEVFKLIWSIKSTINVRDQYYLVRLMCPKELRPLNYFRLFIKGIYLLSLPIRRLFSRKKS